MAKSLKDYLLEFDIKYKDVEYFDSTFHKNTLGVVSYASRAKAIDVKGSYSEEYIRTRFVYALVNSGFFPKEHLCIEFNIPKGNNGKALKPDIVAFKNKDWLQTYEHAKANKDFKVLRQNYLVIFETKNNNKSLESAIENQLRPALAENESKERVFGVYFDDKTDILVFKKIGNSPLRRFDESIELSGSGLINLNYDKRDGLFDFPTFKDFENNNASISDVTKLTTDALDAIDEVAFEDFLAELKRIADKEKPKHSERDLIVEFLTLKVFDEKRSKRDKSNLNFYIEAKEKKTDGLAEKSFRERIDKLYKDAKREYVNVLATPYFSYDTQLRPTNSNEERFLIALVESLQKRAILKAKNESFNQIIFNNFGNEKQKADNGQFFTPIPVVKSIIQMLNPIKDEELCDPCCGICDFPAMAFRHAHRKDEEYPPNASHYYGFDIENNNLKLAELNLVLNGDGGAVLKNMNSISQKLLENGSILKLGEFTKQNFEIETWRHKDDTDKELKKFKIIATNPPFGKGRDLKTGADGKWDVAKETIELYETYKAKPTPNSNGQITLPNSMDMGVIFLENAFKLLEDGGRMGIVLSNSIASISEWENVRTWFIERMRIVGLFDLPANTFGETGVATTVIIAYKPKADEKHLLDNDYEIFIKEVENIGYEVKTVKRTITFKPQFVINEETFEHTSQLDEDFSIMQKEFKEFLKRQELEIKNGFNFDKC
ncbi:N-6 DNA methylase [Flavobacterium sp. ALJ2]|uniref:HsdM family class I SAM-dependent methyltransferase n=1 Tax=Flavobacterium sp. ALJ2 TaxID=2786960 RepID=UPI00189C8F94|nr:N-6 DNA methylase [Flavobacterium sp. ALJ2]MBF7090200.1 N-6 DNA methylase [Flavobacterium sp. ALJ2]